MSGVRGQVSRSTCQVSRVRCQVSPFFLSGGISLLRDCYQWGLPHLVFIISRDFKIYPVQSSTVQNRGRSAVHYIAVHCKLAICYTVKFNAVQEIELLCIETIYIFKTFQWSALHIKEVQCNSMDSNIDQCSAVECTAAQPRLTKSQKKKKNPFCFVLFLVSVLLLALFEIFGVPRMQDFL